METLRGLSIDSVHAERFEDLPISAFERLMTINYLGIVHSVKTVLPGMLTRREGHLVFVSSSMGLLGKMSILYFKSACCCMNVSSARPERRLAIAAFTGYAAYTPSKYAVRGLADTLRNEVSPGAAVLFATRACPVDHAVIHYKLWLLEHTGCVCEGK